MLILPFLETESTADFRASCAGLVTTQASAPRPSVCSLTALGRSSARGSRLRKAPSSAALARRAGSGSETNTRAP